MVSPRSAEPVDQVLALFGLYPHLEALYRTVCFCLLQSAVSAASHCRRLHAPTFCWMVTLSFQDVSTFQCPESNFLGLALAVHTGPVEFGCCTNRVPGSWEHIGAWGVSVLPASQMLCPKPSPSVGSPFALCLVECVYLF